MRRLTQASDKRQGVLLRPSHESDKILQMIQESSQQFGKELEDADFQRWLRDLARYPLTAIEFAFEKWHLGGRFFPQPADILELCTAWEPNIPKYVEGCDALCKGRHGNGYSETDMKYLCELVSAKITSEHRSLDQSLTDADIDALLDDLDKKRGGAPEWRVA